MFVCAALSVGLRGPGGDGEAEEGAHRGSEGDQKAAGEENVQDPSVALLTGLPVACVYFLLTFCCRPCCSGAAGGVSEGSPSVGGGAQ